jgi:hypothetical protein
LRRVLFCMRRFANERAMGKLSNHQFLVALVLLCGALLRWYNFDGFSLTNDELSALLRANQASLSDLITKGVMATDPHPAGIQVFIYFWVKWWGTSAFAFRLPFVLLSIGTLWMTYRLGRLWFGAYPAVLAMTLMAVLEFPILYGQIARPYSPGLFFSVALVYYWTKLVLARDKPWPAVPAYALFALLCCYTHYFCGLFAVIVASTGLFMVKRTQWRAYIVANLMVVVLFLPHFGITLHQMETGGLSGWLPKPKPSFLMEHLFFLFNNSIWLSTVTIFTFCIAGVYYRKDLRKSVFRWLSLLWFLMPIGIAYIYSMNYETVLMDRVLLFSFPFLLLFVASFVQPNEITKWGVGLVAVLLGTGMAATVWEKRYYSTAHFEDFELLASTVKKWDKLYGDTNITRTVNVNDSFYLNYYFDQLEYKTTFQRIKTIDAIGLRDMLRTVEEAKTPYFMAAWACIYNPYEVPEIIKRKYPVEVDRVFSFNTELVLYQQAKAKEHREAVVFESVTGCERETKWTIDDITLDTLHRFNACPSFRFTSQLEYGPTFRLLPTELLLDSVNVVSFSAWYLGNLPLNAMLVLSVDQDGQNLAWRSVELGQFITKEGEWTEAILSLKLPEGLVEKGQVSAYIWNKGKQRFSVGRLQVTAFKDSRYHYYD